MLSGADHQALLDVAVAAGLAAAHRLRERDGAWSGVAAELGRDRKANADVPAEKVILAQLRAATDLPILAEESGGVEQVRGARAFWVVDPLDGSFNYTVGLPFYGVSIALVEEERPVLGAIIDVERDTVFSGIVGIGAAMDHVPMRVSPVESAGRATLMTGLPARADYGVEALAAMAGRFASYRKVRMLGSAAVMLAQVAAGRAEVYHETGTMLWDVAAGMALVQAAGGRVAGWPEALDRPFDLLAWNGRFDPP